MSNSRLTDEQWQREKQKYNNNLSMAFYEGPGPQKRQRHQPGSASDDEDNGYPNKRFCVPFQDTMDRESMNQRTWSLQGSLDRGLVNQIVTGAIKHLVAFHQPRKLTAGIDRSTKFDHLKFVQANGGIME